MTDRYHLSPVPSRDDSSPTPDTDAQAQAASVARQQVAQAFEADQTKSPYRRSYAQEFDWGKYHSAWQQYYQKYYHQYYWRQLQIEREKLQPGLAVEQQQVITGANQDQPPPRATQTKIIRDDIRQKVADRAKKVRGSRHFVPLISALVVGSGFLFLQFNSILIANLQSYISPGHFSQDSVAAIDPSNITVNPEPRLIIPKISVDVPVDYNVTGLTESQILLGLREAAVHYNLPGANAVPGQFGNTIILGHSGNDIFSTGNYKFMFVLLDKMAPGDTFYLHYQSKQYVYKVSQVKIINPDQVSELEIGNAKAVATLVTCTPPGSSLQRRLVFGEQISPDPSGAKPASTSQTADVKATIPGTSPTILDQIWSFLFR